MSRSKMILYAYRRLETPGDVKIGECFVEGIDDFEQYTRDYIRKNLGKEKYLWDTGQIDVVGIWDVSRYARKVGRFYKHSRVDDVIRERVGYRISKRTEYHRPPCSPDVAGNWVRDKINIILTGAKASFPLRDEQKKAVNTIVRFFRNGGRDFLLNAKMRFGKTFTAYNIIRRLGCRTVLVVTFKPSVRDSWKGDMLNHRLFKNFEWLSADQFSKREPITLRRKAGKTVVLFASAQDFNDFHRKGKWSKIKDHKFDMVVYDEHHFGASSERSLKALEKLSFKWLLALSGTPIKDLLRGRFGADNTFTWSYADEQRKRRAEKKGRWKTSVYRELPVMSIHRMHLSQDVKDRVLSQYSTDEGFTMRKMFATVGKRHDAVLKDVGTVEHFLDLMAGQPGCRDSGMNIFRKLEGCTIPLDHMAWFLPSVDAVYALAKVLRQHPFFKKFRIVTLSCDDYGAYSAPAEVRSAIVQNNKTITLSYMMMNTGVTVPEWSAVFMLNDMESAETYFQSIFRCQSPWKIDGKIQKEECHVFDFNPARVVQMVYEYSSILAPAGKSAVEMTREFLDYANVLDHTENGMERVDGEMFTDLFAVEGDYAAVFGSVRTVDMTQWDDDLIDILDNIALNKGKISIDLSKNGMKKGKNYKTSGSGISKTRSKNLQLQLKRKIQSALRQLPFVLALTEEIEESFQQLLDSYDQPLTIPDSWVIFSDDLDELTVDDILTQQTGIDAEGWEELIEYGVVRIDEINKQIISLNVFMKESPEKITEKLVTADALVKKHGVVFTPMSLVNEMLDALPEHVWTDPDLRWLEPCVGSGNFAVSIVDRLMVGLEEEIPSEAKRRRHILEKMLYMVELLPVNCLLTARRLDPAGKYKLQLNCADTLKHQFPHQFNVVVMNPPYSESNKGKGGNAVYDDFMLLMMNLSDMVLCVTPGSFIRRKSFFSLREKLNNFGIDNAWCVDENIFPASVENPTVTFLRKGAADTIEDWLLTDSDRLYDRIITQTSIPTMKFKSGYGAVCNDRNKKLVSTKQSDRYSVKYIDRIAKRGPQFCYAVSKLKPKFQKGKLVVFAQRSGNSPKMHLLNSIEYSYSQNVMATTVETKQEFEFLKRLFASSLFKFLLLIQTGGTTRTRKGMPAAHTAGALSRLPYPQDLPDNFTDQDLYEYFNLTKDEIDLIERTIN